MKLFETIQDLKQMHQNAQNALNQTQNALSESNVRQILNDSFKKEFSSLANSISKEADNILSTKATELSENNKRQVESLFLENLSEISAQTAQNLPINTISKQIAQEFAKENEKLFKDNLKVVVNEALSLNEFKTLLKESKETIVKEKEHFLQNASLYDLDTTAESLILNYLETNKQEIFNKIDIEFLTPCIMEYIENNEELNATLTNEAKALIARKVTYLTLREEILTILKERAVDVFNEVIAYQELLEKRFLADLQLSALCLLGELGSITKILQALSDIKIAEDRFNALQNLNPQEPKLKIFKVI